jgi:hypothetical protein
MLSTVSRMRRYLDRLCGRCQQKHFPRDDPLNVAANEALVAVQKLEAVLGDCDKASPKT